MYDLYIWRIAWLCGAYLRQSLAGKWYRKGRPKQRKGTYKVFPPYVRRKRKTYIQDEINSNDAQSHNDKALHDYLERAL